MINYIIDLDEYSNIYTTSGIERYCGYKKVINYIASYNLVDIKAYLKLVRKKLNMKYNIPIQINNNTLLFKINNYYINYYEIWSFAYNGNKVHIIFKSGDYLLLNVSYKLFTKYFKMSFEIDNYLKKRSEYY
ncbi:MAG: hypothetical protein ACI35W_03560 [Anaeroplasmataceae bacterium]